MSDDHKDASIDLSKLATPPTTQVSTSQATPSIEEIARSARHNLLVGHELNSIRLTKSNLQPTSSEDSIKEMDNGASPSFSLPFDKD